LNRNPLKTPKPYLLLFALLLITTPAYAYLDSGTGSMILQGLIAGIAMISLTIKMYWCKFIGMFRKQDSLQTDNEEQRNQEKTNPKKP
jgi:hypothetical protein